VLSLHLRTRLRRWSCDRNAPGSINSSTDQEGTVFFLVEDVKNPIQVAKRDTTRSGKAVECVKVVEIRRSFPIVIVVVAQRVLSAVQRPVRTPVDNLEDVGILKTKKRRCHRQIDPLTIQQPHQHSLCLPMILWAQAAEGLQGVAKRFPEFNVAV